MTELKNEDYKLINLHDQIFIDETKKYLKGNLHTHTTKSDGKYSREEVLGIYKENGYDFLGITDHNIFCDENIDKDIVLLHGIESSCIYAGIDDTKGEYTHFCCFDCQNPNNERQYYKDYLELQNNIDNIKKNYSLIQFNHPLFSRLLDNEVIKLKGYNLLEIYNHKDFLRETGMQNAEMLVRTLLNHHHKLWVTANDDFHGPYNKTVIDKCFGGYIMVEAEKDEKSILSSIKDGKFYATTGPRILDYRIEGQTIKIKTSPVKKIIFYSNMRNCKNIYDKNNDDINYGEYIIKGDEFYIWAKIIDQNGNIAWAQPIYINQ